MATFMLGLIILFAGGFLYGGLCQKAFSPDERQTPAYSKQDGMDYVPISKWKNTLINLLNIAGTGPILGPIQGILFGPIAFFTIPIGCVIGGAVHDYLAGMISVREGGIQMPEIIKRTTNKAIHKGYTVFLCLAMALAVVVFIYTPGDIAATQLLGFGGGVSEPSTWIIYGVIFVYYIVATLFPIDKIIGRIYPFFGAILMFATVGIFAMMLIKGYPLVNVWETWTLNGFDFGEYFRSQNFIPVFFVTVACGILSGFHSTQIALVSRTMESEKDGRVIYYDAMIMEGFIAMVWAAATMAMIGLGAENAGITIQQTAGGYGFFSYVGGTLQQISATSVVGVVCKNLLGPIGGVLAIWGVVILPITTGDTLLRALRIILAESLGINKKKNQYKLTAAVFSAGFLILLWAKINPNGFNTLWKYFGWSNQIIAIFSLAAVTIWFMKNDRKKQVWIPMIPLVFYSYIISAYIFSAPIGFSLPLSWASVIGGVFTVAVVAAVVYKGGLKQI